MLVRVGFVTPAGNLRERMAAWGRAGKPQGSSRHWRFRDERHKTSAIGAVDVSAACDVDVVD